LQIIRLAPILSALILAACAGQPISAPAPIVEPPRSVGAARGIDLATDTNDVLSELATGRVDFVARYYRDPSSRWPALSASEAQHLSSLGLKIVAVWESHSRHPWYFSYPTGYADAVTAYRQARAIGQPAGSAIYFAVDFDARRQALAAVDEYFRGIAAGFAAASGGSPEYRVGVYGSGAVCDAVKQAGLAQYSWLSNSIAWAGSFGYDDWNIRQGGRLAELSFNHDFDEARDEYGGFQLANDEAAAARDAVAPRAPQERQWLSTEVTPSL
jgi:Domain of unknown function (DUF1906)